MDRRLGIEGGKEWLLRGDDLEAVAGAAIVHGHGQLGGKGLDGPGRFLAGQGVGAAHGDEEHVRAAAGRDQRRGGRLAQIPRWTILSPSASKI